MHGLVYLAQNMITGECYVGATTVGLKTRMKAHIRKAKKGSNRKFYEGMGS